MHSRPSIRIIAALTTGIFLITAIGVDPSYALSLNRQSRLGPHTISATSYLTQEPFLKGAAFSLYLAKLQKILESGVKGPGVYSGGSLWALGWRAVRDLPEDYRGVGDHVREIRYETGGEMTVLLDDGQLEIPAGATFEEIAERVRAGTQRVSGGLVSPVERLGPSAVDLLKSRLGALNEEYASLNPEQRRAVSDVFARVSGGGDMIQSRVAHTVLSGAAVVMEADVIRPAGAPRGDGLREDAARLEVDGWSLEQLLDYMISYQVLDEKLLEMLIILTDSGGSVPRTVWREAVVKYRKVLNRREFNRVLVHLKEEDLIKETGGLFVANLDELRAQVKWDMDRRQLKKIFLEVLGGRGLARWNLNPDEWRGQIQVLLGKWARFSVSGAVIEEPESLTSLNQEQLLEFLSDALAAERYLIRHERAMKSALKLMGVRADASIGQIVFRYATSRHLLHVGRRQGEDPSARVLTVDLGNISAHALRNPLYVLHALSHSFMKPRTEVVSAPPFSIDEFRQYGSPVLLEAVDEVIAHKLSAQIAQRLDISDRQWREYLTSTFGFHDRLAGGHAVRWAMLAAIYTQSRVFERASFLDNWLMEATEAGIDDDLVNALRTLYRQSGFKNISEAARPWQEMQETDLLRIAVRHYKTAADILGVSEKQLKPLLTFDRNWESDITFPRDNGEPMTVKGFRVWHRRATWTGRLKWKEWVIEPASVYGGGFRITPSVDLEECQGLSMMMSNKSALLGLPVGGSKGGIRADLKELSLKEQFRMIRSYVNALRRDEVIGPHPEYPDRHLDRFAPDQNITEEMILVFLDQYIRLMTEERRLSHRLFESSLQGVLESVRAREALLSVPNDEPAETLFLDAYLKVLGQNPRLPAPELAVISSKPVRAGGLAVRKLAVGLGGSAVLDEFLRHSSILRPKKGEALRVAIQGFGPAGYSMAHYLALPGWRYRYLLQYLGDMSGYFYKEAGFDPEDVERDMREHGRRTIGGYGPVDRVIGREEFFSSDVDILIPAATGGVITSVNEADIRAPVVEELGNGAVTYPAANALASRPKVVLSGELANSGAFFVSNIEADANVKGRTWDDDRIGKLVVAVMRDTTRRVMETSKSFDPTIPLSNAVMVFALKRMLGGQVAELNNQASGDGIEMEALERADRTRHPNWLESTFLPGRSWSHKMDLSHVKWAYLLPGVMVGVVTLAAYVLGVIGVTGLGHSLLVSMLTFAAIDSSGQLFGQDRRVDLQQVLAAITVIGLYNGLAIHFVFAWMEQFLWPVRVLVATLHGAISGVAYLGLLHTLHYRIRTPEHSIRYDEFNEAVTKKKLMQMLLYVVTLIDIPRHVVVQGFLEESSPTVRATVSLVTGALVGVTLSYITNRVQSSEDGGTHLSGDGVRDATMKNAAVRLHELSTSENKAEFQRYALALVHDVVPYFFEQEEQRVYLKRLGWLAPHDLHGLRRLLRDLSWELGLKRFRRNAAMINLSQLAPQLLEEGRISEEQAEAVKAAVQEKEGVIRSTLLAGRAVWVYGQEVRLDPLTGRFFFDEPFMSEGFKKIPLVERAPPKIVIGVLVHNGWDDVKALLQSLWHMGTPNVEVVVLDNGSAENRLRELERFADVPAYRLMFMRTESNLGFDEGHNAVLDYALDEARADYYLALNDDCVVGPGFMNGLLAAFEDPETRKLIASDRPIGAVGPLVFNLEGAQRTPVIQSYGRPHLRKVLFQRQNTGFGSSDPSAFPSTMITDTVVGPAVLYPTSALRAIGGYDPRFFMYGEEPDMALRLEDAGYISAVTQGSKIWHKGWGNSSGGDRSRIMSDLVVRNRFLLLRKHAQLRDMKTLVSIAMRIVYFSFGRFLRALVYQDAALALAPVKGVLDGMLGRFSTVQAGPVERVVPLPSARQPAAKIPEAVGSRVSSSGDGLASGDGITDENEWRQRIARASSIHELNQLPAAFAQEGRPPLESKRKWSPTWSHWFRTLPSEAEKFERAVAKRREQIAAAAYDRVARAVEAMDDTPALELALALIKAPGGNAVIYLLTDPRTKGTVAPLLLKALQVSDHGEAVDILRDAAFEQQGPFYIEVKSLIANRIRRLEDEAAVEDRLAEGAKNMGDSWRKGSSSAPPSTGAGDGMRQHKPRTIWWPKRDFGYTIHNTNVGELMQQLGFSQYSSLLRWASRNPTSFYDAIARPDGHLGLVWDTPYENVLSKSGGPFGDMRYQWFKGGQINLYRNAVERHLGRTRDRGNGHHGNSYDGADDDRGDDLAIIWLGENGERSELTYAELDDEVGNVAAALRKIGVGEGTAVGVVMPALPETVIAQLALWKLGAVAVPMSPGSGTALTAHRLRESGARFVITVDGTTRKGRVQKLAHFGRKEETPGETGKAGYEVALGKALVDQALEEIPGVERVVVLRSLDEATMPMGSVPMRPGRDLWWDEWLAKAKGEPVPDTVATDADHPAIYAFSSGTTGLPKGLIHSHGGLTVNVAKEHVYHFDLRRGDRFAGWDDIQWMMGDWKIIGTLMRGATLVMMYGDPFATPDRLWQAMQDETVTHLGLSPKQVRKNIASDPRLLNMIRKYDLSSLHFFGSTGGPWDERTWRFLFEEVGQSRIPVINISGGTDLFGALMANSPLAPLKPGTLWPALGMHVGLFDDEGHSTKEGHLVWFPPFGPSQTHGILGDDTGHSRFRKTYFSKFAGVWSHGDWASRKGNMYTIHGRADGTYRYNDQFVSPGVVESAALKHPAVAEALNVGVPNPETESDIVVFAVLNQGWRPSPELADDIKTRIVQDLGKTFRVRDVHFVIGLPQTQSGKDVHDIVRAAYTGGAMRDTSSLSLESAGFIKEIRKAGLNARGDGLTAGEILIYGAWTAASGLGVWVFIKAHSVYQQHLARRMRRGLEDQLSDFLNQNMNGKWVEDPKTARTALDQLIDGYEDLHPAVMKESGAEHVVTVLKSIRQLMDKHVSISHILRDAQEGVMKFRRQLDYFKEQDFNEHEKRPEIKTAVLKIWVTKEENWKEFEAFVDHSLTLFSGAGIRTDTSVFSAAKEFLKGIQAEIKRIEMDPEVPRDHLFQFAHEAFNMADLAFQRVFDSQAQVLKEEFTRFADDLARTRRWGGRPTGDGVTSAELLVNGATTLLLGGFWVYFAVEAWRSNKEQISQKKFDNEFIRFLELNRGGGWTQAPLVAADALGKARTHYKNRRDQSQPAAERERVISTLQSMLEISERYTRLQTAVRDAEEGIQAYRSQLDYFRGSGSRPAVIDSWINNTREEWMGFIQRSVRSLMGAGIPIGTVVAMGLDEFLVDANIAIDREEGRLPQVEEQPYQYVYERYDRAMRMVRDAHSVGTQILTREFTERAGEIIQALGSPSQGDGVKGEGEYSAARDSRWINYIVIKKIAVSHSSASMADFNILLDLNDYVIVQFSVSLPAHVTPSQIFDFIEGFLAEKERGEPGIARSIPYFRERLPAELKSGFHAHFPLRVLEQFPGLWEAIQQYPKPDGVTIRYTVSGGRGPAKHLNHAMFRLGLLMALLSMKEGKITGLVVTGSHNPSNENGGKGVDALGEMMPTAWEEYAHALINADDADVPAVLQTMIEGERISVQFARSARVYLGRDTRPSSPHLAGIVREGVEALGAHAVDFGEITTPQLHHAVRAVNTGTLESEEHMEDAYFSQLVHSYASVLAGISRPTRHTFHVDAAFGVGAPKLERLNEEISSGQIPGAAYFSIFNRVGERPVNDHAGQDFVEKLRKLPQGVDPVTGRYKDFFTIDGDVDRLTGFRVGNDGNPILYRGERMAALFAQFIQGQLKAARMNLSIGIVMTRYANGAAEEYIRKTTGLQPVFTRTGVKNLYHEAKRYDIGIYLEPNGHGTILFSDRAVEALTQALQGVKAAPSEPQSAERELAITRLLGVSRLMNQAIGDALPNLLLVAALLAHRGWDMEEWGAQYADLPQVQVVVSGVPRASDLRTNDDESRIVSHAHIQEDVDAAVKRYTHGRAFARPSNTESIVRVLAEADTWEHVQSLASEVAYIIERHFKENPAKGDGISEPDQEFLTQLHPRTNIVPVVTPLTSAGEIDKGGITRLVQQLDGVSEHDRRIAQEENRVSAFGGGKFRELSAPPATHHPLPTTQTVFGTVPAHLGNGFALVVDDSVLSSAPNKTQYQMLVELFGGEGIYLFSDWKRRYLEGSAEPQAGFILSAESKKELAGFLSYWEQSEIPWAEEFSAGGMSQGWAVPFHRLLTDLELLQAAIKASEGNLPDTWKSYLLQSVLGDVDDTPIKSGELKMIGDGLLAVLDLIIQA
ncbi:MAG: AMP-binding protein [Candidatus Omnitrophica bacterium]|nr:AMP-binding protein [Candidatus Omnitrophota bacterium]